ncbi:MAG: ribonuclease E activity regulator RraA [Ignavibacteria bacterium]|nr:ribonuclease E activity regulator RraA [Ignavibacteria bacterium]
MKIKTTDLCDEHIQNLKVAKPGMFRDYGGKKDFYGLIRTVKCQEPGEGKVLVIDGGASYNCALLGDMLGELAIKNKWNGIIVNGCIRDSAELSQLGLGVKALATHPLKSKKENKGEENIKVNFAGIDFAPGEFVYCDEDGIVVSADKYF